MSNNNNTRSIYNKSVNGANDDEMELLLSSANPAQEAVGNNQITTIDIENDMSPGTSQQYLQRQHFQQIHREGSATRINIDANALNQQAANGNDMQHNDEGQRLPNLFAMWREARHQFIRSQSLRDHYTPPAGENTPPNNHSRTWRENLYEVLSSPVSPRAHTQVLRALFNSSANVRYEYTNVLFPDDQLHLSINHQNNQREGELQSSSRNHRINGLETQSSSTLRLSRQSSRVTDERSFSDNSTPELETPVTDPATDNDIAVNSAGNGGRAPQRQSSVNGGTPAPTVDMVDDTDANAVGELIVKLVTHLIRYLPFLFIIFVKFIHDNLLGILDILILHSVVYSINKTVKDQVAKLNQKSLFILVRDLLFVILVVSYRFILSTTAPDPFGLLINPPGILEMSPTQNVEPTKVLDLDVNLNQFANAGTVQSLNSSVSVAKHISLGSLLYYVAVNDLILKLLTQIVKLIVTMFPTGIIRHKSRVSYKTTTFNSPINNFLFKARLYALTETFSQFYRAVVPIRQWLKYLYESYVGLEVVSPYYFYNS